MKGITQTKCKHEEEWEKLLRANQVPVSLRDIFQCETFLYLTEGSILLATTVSNCFFVRKENKLFNLD